MASKITKPNHLLRQERLKRGWTLDKVADELYKLCRKEPRAGMRGDINAQMISKWETGKTPTSLYYRRLFCTLYGKSAEELGFLENERQEISEAVDTPVDVYWSQFPGQVGKIK